MPPSVLLDNTSDFNSTSDSSISSLSRTLLLAPPSLAAHEETLRDVLSHHDRAATDLQMLDRLSAGSAKLPQMSYDLILILNDVNGTRTESAQYLDRSSFQQIFNALKAGGRVKAQDKTLSQDHNSTDFREAILAGLILDDGGMIKPKYSTSDTVPIKLLKGRSKNQTGHTTKDTVNSLNNSAITHPNNLESRKNETRNLNYSVKPSFIDDDAEELIDEDTLLTEEEINRPLNIPTECAPKAGKRRRACKDCTCGLAEKLAAEDAARRSDADAQLRVLKLGVDELAEVDFTVQGKVGSCGNCSLGDAFRCASCPYIGMPAFKPGEEVDWAEDSEQLPIYMALLTIVCLLPPSNSKTAIKFYSNHKLKDAKPSTLGSNTIDSFEPCILLQPYEETPTESGFTSSPLPNQTTRFHFKT